MGLLFALVEAAPRNIRMPEEIKKNTYPAKIARILLKTILFIFLFVVLIFLLVLTPPVQKFLTARVETFLQNKLGTEVGIGSISFGLSGSISLQDIYVEDKTGDTLLSGGSVKSHLSFLKLFSNEVQVKDIELQNITAKIKRVKPDTVFNYQFVVDAFVTPVDTTTTSAPMQLSISDVTLENVRLFFNDDVTGSNMYARLGNVAATIDTFDIYAPQFAIPSVIARNVQLKLNQTKPLVSPDPISKDLQEAAATRLLKLSIGTIDLSKIDIDYQNDVSAFYTRLNIGSLKGKARHIDLNNSVVHLEELSLANAKSVVRLGRGAAAKVVEQEVKKEVVVQKQQGWNIKADRIRIDNNDVKFDNDNSLPLSSGIDFAHIDATGLTLHANDFVMSMDSTGANIIKGAVKDKSGFVLEELTGNLLYATNQSYLKDLYIKTPGSEIKRSAVLEYQSFDALMKNFEETIFDIDLVDSRLQVKDILLFAPQLRNNAALANPNDVWYLNLVANGTLNRMFVEQLQFNGLKETRINANGTLVGLMKPTTAGGNFTIHQLHTTQTDMALFTGQRLSTPQLLLPETFDINGTLNGNAGKINAALNVNTSMGFVAVNGSLSNIMSPTKAAYNARIKTNNLRLGQMLRQQGQIGSLSGSFLVSGTGLTPGKINTKFSGNVASVGFNGYQYRNIKLNGSLRGEAFTINADANDANADFNITSSGVLSATPSFTVNGMIDSLKTLPLNFSTQPLIVRGKIEGTVRNYTPDYLDADVLITKALFVSNEMRLPLDTIQLTAGRNGDENFIRFTSDVATASINGQYRIADLGSIIQNTIQPYFTVAPPAAIAVQPYNFSFRADVNYTPILSTFVPGLTAMQPLHAEGTLTTGHGMDASMTTQQIVFAGTEMSDLNVAVNTSDSGLIVRCNVGHIKSGNSFDVFNTRFNATALNNVIDFKLGIDDAAARNKYLLAGVVNQPTPGTYAISLRPDSLLLNYERWTVTPNNVITISPNRVSASDFVLQLGNQSLSINSIAGGAGQQPLQATFNNFRLATITGFVKSDSLLADGVMNGNITFQNLAMQPAFTSNLTINDLSLRQDTIGNVNFQVSNTGNDRYNTNVTITGRGNDVLLNGYFIPRGSVLDLNLDLDVRALQLATMEGAFAPSIASASGALKGKVQLRGTTAAPQIQGNIAFDSSSFILTMLGSRFFINDEQLTVTENGLDFDSFTIRDSANNALVIDGNVATTNFINYNFNLNVTARNFLALNAAKAPNKLYYGRLNISTNLHIAGTETMPVVDGSLTVNDGTNLVVVVPQREFGVEQREGIVQFVDMDAPENDTLFARYDSLNRSSILGMDIAVNIEVKKEAAVNVVLDEVNGDFLNMQGEALLSAGIDPSGKITLVGNYILDNGAYELSFNFLRRRFIIDKGSTITWTGEPTTAQMNVTATYIANTAPLDLVENQIAGPSAAIRNTYLQKLPFEVKLTMTGELLKPVITFDILLPDDKSYGVSNEIVAQVNGRLNQLRLDEGEINKQVFSLLLLGRFIGDNPFQSSGAGFSAGSYARQSVSRLLTEQLNNLAGGLIAGVEINFDVTSTDDYTTGALENRTDLNVGLSKRLLNDRLKVTVGSNFELEGPQNNSQRANNIAGNVALDYMLSKDGRYLVRYFRRNQYEVTVDGYIIENGLSFIMSVDFNKFKEIFGRRKQKIAPQQGTTLNSPGQ